RWSLQSQKARPNCDTRPDSKSSYNRGMNENLSRELLAWLTQAGLAGTPESDIFSVFCDRCVAAGIPLGRAHVAIDTLHPVHEGSLFRWGYPNEPQVYEYGRTSLEGLDASGALSLDAQATDVWRRGPFYNMLQTGASLLRRRLNADTRRDRCTQGCCRIEKTPQCGRQASNRHVPRLACRQGFLWQCGEPGAARLYGSWTGGKRGKPHRGRVPFTL